MSHARVKPAGWAVNEKLTSAQQNQLDINVSESVDKTVAGDTVSGVLTFASASGVTMQSGSALTQNSGATAALSGVTTVTGAASKITTASSGRIEHGDNDYPQLAVGHTGRTMVRYYSFGQFPRVGDSNADIGLIGMTLAAAEAAAFILPVHHGAVLTSAAVRFIPNTGHANLPGTNIALTIARRSNAVGGAQATANLLSTGAVSYAPVGAPATADYNDGLIKALTLTCDQNHTIDRTQYSYDLTLTNESGTDSAATLFVALVLTFSSITDLRIG
jgi:hypothetical protein